MVGTKDVNNSRNRWAEQEETALASEITKHHDVPIIGCGAIKIGEVRRRGWEAVANVLNWLVVTYVPNISKF
ncbi:hypothetical protein DPMN_056393 [Dreissena polymorpha]|uniref:Uncharacterized protein n=1 Tax=Dreissena polymorpha TaxID=45954 RepID=A0A9D4HRG8_DREPO|nr:hypothetical protein DPMN_056393 [Dreissena polymorpha]